LELPPSWNDGAVARNPGVSWAFLFLSVTVTDVGVADKMKLIALAVILSCCFVHAYCTAESSECSADEITTIQQQWTTTFGSDGRRLFEFGAALFLRSALFRDFLYNPGRRQVYKMRRHALTVRGQRRRRRRGVRSNYRESGERCKLPQWSLGRSSSRQQFL